MKKPLHFLLLLSLTFSAAHAQWWTPQASGTNQSLNDVSCLTSADVVVVGDAGTILKTTDGGASWSPRNAGISQSLHRVQFLDGVHGFVVGDDGTLLKTGDGGESWSAVNSGTTEDLYGLFVLNESVWYVSGSNGTIRKTEDGGASFSTLPFPVTASVVRLQFLDANVGYAMAEGLYKTTDGGATWELKYDLPYPGIEFATPFYFISANVGFVADFYGTVYRTTDGGDIFSFFSSMGYGPLDVFASNDSSIWGLNNAVTLCGCDSFCIQKSDLAPDEQLASVENCELGGENTGRFQAIRFANTTTGYVVGRNGKIFKNSTGMMEPLATESFGRQTISVYPNPSAGHFTIALGQGKAASMQIEMTDALGKIVYTTSAIGQEATVDTSRLAKGLYFLSVTLQGRKHTEKVIVN